MIPYLPEFYKIVDATAGPVTTNGGVTGAYVSAKLCHFLFLVLQFTQAAGHATVITLKEATAVAGTGVQTVANTMKIWQNADTATSDTLVAATAATSLTLAADVKKKIVVFGIDPARLSAGFDVVGYTVSDSSQAGNFVSGAYYLYSRYPGASLPSSITD